MRKWYHVVLTYDNDLLCFYVNGNLTASSAKNFESRFLEGDSVIVGRRFGVKNNRYFQGVIDDIEMMEINEFRVGVWN